MAFNQTAAAPSHKMRRCLLMAFALIALAITALPTASFAGTDTAGNVLATDNDANPSGVEGDLYWAGQALNLDDTSIDRDIIAAGDTVTIDGTVEGDVEVWADKLILGKNAHITGTVNAHVPRTPSVPREPRSVRSRSTAPRTRILPPLTMSSAASSPRHSRPALSLCCSSSSFRARPPAPPACSTSAPCPCG